MGSVEVFYWIALGVVFYTYIGYGIVLISIVKLKLFFQSAKKLENDIFEPTVTLFVAAYNEIKFIEEKLENTFNLDYPKEKIQILFVTDGSNDGTPEFLSKYKNVEVIHEDARGGKIGAINRGMRYVRNSIVIYSDANALLNVGAIRQIVKHYKDPKVGCVAGEKRVLSGSNLGGSGASEGIYWKYESFLKLYDYKLYSAVGAAGELFSIRTELHQEVEPDTILDDLIISLRIAMKGYKIAYEPQAYATEFASSSLQNEMKRKIRISAGGIQSIFRLLPLLNIFRYKWLSFAYVSHRVLRWSITPFLMLALLPLNIVISLNVDLYIYDLLLLGQFLFYLTAIIGAIFEKINLKFKLFFIPFYFLFMNFCLFLGIIRFYKGKQTVLWEKARM